MRTLLALLAFVTCGTGQERPPLRVDVNLVNVALAVRGADGTLAADLSRDDFEVWEDGVPQKIDFFAHSADLPLALGLVVDFSGSQEHFVKDHHRHLQKFLDDVLRPGDQAFLVGFGNHLRLLGDFSSSSDHLVEALTEYEHGHGHVAELGPPHENRDLGTAFYDAIYYSVTEKLANVTSGQKGLIVFSDGEDNSSAQDMLDAIEAAQRENVRVFGLRYTQREHGRLTARNRYGIREMARLAKETGGADFDVEQGDVQTWFREIAEDLRSSYELAYYPSTGPSAGPPAGAADDDSFHKIAVRVKRSGLTVRCRTGYFTRPAP
jgi:Ca-activated chloride channel homolog